MKLYEILNENVEDEQSEANERAVTLLMMAQTFMNKDEFSGYKKAWNQALKNFSDGYEEDNDNLMYGGLDDLEGVAQDLEDPVRDYFEDDFDSKYRSFSERTHEFEAEKKKEVEEYRKAYYLGAEALAKYRANQKK